MKDIDISGMLAIGNGEPCPFCKDFIMEEGADFLKHCLDKHPEELNKALFIAKPKPEYWLEKEFVQLIAHISAKLRIMREAEDSLKEEEYKLTMQSIYYLIQDYYNEVITHESD